MGLLLDVAEPDLQFEGIRDNPVVIGVTVVVILVLAVIFFIINKGK